MSENDRQDATRAEIERLAEKVRVAKLKLSGLADVTVANLLPGAPRIARETSALLDELLAAQPPGAGERPKIVCLCGSTRFYQEFQVANYEETMAGRIVLSVGFYPDSTQHHETVGLTNAGYPMSKKAELDELHLRKIDLADEVLVLNVGGYIGESTQREIAYAEAHGKPVRYLEPAVPSSGGSREPPEDHTHFDALRHWAAGRRSAEPKPPASNGENPMTTDIGEAGVPSPAQVEPTAPSAPEPSAPAPCQIVCGGCGAPCIMTPGNVHGYHHKPGCRFGEWTVSGGVAPAPCCRPCQAVREAAERFAYHNNPDMERAARSRLLEALAEPCAGRAGLPRKEES